MRVLVTPCAYSKKYSITPPSPHVWTHLAFSPSPSYSQWNAIPPWLVRRVSRCPLPYSKCLLTPLASVVCTMSPCPSYLYPTSSVSSASVTSVTAVTLPLSSVSTRSVSSLDVDISFRLPAAPYVNLTAKPSLVDTEETILYPCLFSGPLKRYSIPSASSSRYPSASLVHVSCSSRSKWLSPSPSAGSADSLPSACLNRKASSPSGCIPML